MMQQRHPNMDTYTALLLSYAAGSLDQAQRLVVAAHLSLSPPARKMVTQYESLGAAMMDRMCEPVSMCESALDSVLSRIETRPQQHARPQHPADSLFEGMSLPECLLRALQEQQRQRMRWHQIRQGIQNANLALACRRSRATFYKFAPGVETQRPERTAPEITLILKGAYMDENSMYRLGDLVIYDADEPAHRSKVCREQGCVSFTVVAAPGQQGRIIDMLKGLLGS